MVSFFVRNCTPLPFACPVNTKADAPTGWYWGTVNSQAQKVSRPWYIKTSFHLASLHAWRKCVIRVFTAVVRVKQSIRSNGGRMKTSHHRINRRKQVLPQWKDLNQFTVVECAQIPTLFRRILFRAFQISYCTSQNDLIPKPTSAARPQICINERGQKCPFEKPNMRSTARGMSLLCHNRLNEIGQK